MSDQNIPAENSIESDSTIPVQETEIFNTQDDTFGEDAQENGGYPTEHSKPMEDLNDMNKGTEIETDIQDENVDEIETDIQDENVDKIETDIQEENVDKIPFMSKKSVSRKKDKTPKEKGKGTKKELKKKKTLKKTLKKKNKELNKTLRKLSNRVHMSISHLKQVKNELRKISV